MVGRSARFLAPIALIAVGVAVYLILHSSSLLTHSSTTPQASNLTTTTSAGSTHHHKPKAKFYIVKQGDTLTAIAARTGVSIAVLTELNPAVAAPPYNLQPGQRLRLRR